MTKQSISGLPVIAVVAAIIERGGTVLLARRSAAKDQAGLWEFPGGKIEPGETDQQALARELREEFGIDTEIGPFVTISVHAYEHLVIELRAYRVRSFQGTFQPTDHDAIQWVRIADLATYPMPPADLPIMQALLTNDD